MRLFRVALSTGQLADAKNLIKRLASKYCKMDLQMMVMVMAMVNAVHRIGLLMHLVYQPVLLKSVQNTVRHYQLRHHHHNRQPSSFVQIQPGGGGQQADRGILGLWLAAARGTTGNSKQTFANPPRAASSSAL